MGGSLGYKRVVRRIAEVDSQGAGRGVVYD